MRRVVDIELAALDFETTGLHPVHDRVIEVAIVRGRLGETPRVWCTLVDPGRSVAATAVHGIDDAMVRGQPRFPSLVDRIRAELDGAVLVAHNASFDLGFLRSEFERAGEEPPEPTVLDTLMIARRNYRFPSNSLDGLCGRFGITRARAHRAADDALATFHVLGAILRDLDPDAALTVSQLQDLRRPADHVQRVHARLLMALNAQADVEIEYDAQLVRTRRRIRIQALDRATVRAFCLLREAEREFALERIRWVGDIS